MKTALLTEAQIAVVWNILSRAPLSPGEAMAVELITAEINRQLAASPVVEAPV